MTAMSIEPRSQDCAGPSVARESLDLSGLPAPVADELRKLVTTLRENMGAVPSDPGSVEEESPEAWARRLQAWVDTHPARPISIDDSRESIYSGRGE
jgi:hypothetical protein